MPSEEATSGKPQEDIPKTIKFHFLKTSNFRNIHMDGVFGGITPRGYIQMSPFTERAPIPQVTVHSLDSSGELADEVRKERQTRDGIIREVDVNLIMDIRTAKLLLGWLNLRIQELERIIDQQAKGAEE